MKGILALNGSEVPNVLLLAGDLTYSDKYVASYPDNNINCPKNITPGPGYQPCAGKTNQQRWDTFVRLLEPLFSSFPLVHVGGNHEIEVDAGCYMSGGNNWNPATPTPSTTNTGANIPAPTNDFSTGNPCFQARAGPAPARPPCFG